MTLCVDADTSRVAHQRTARPCKISMCAPAGYAIYHGRPRTISSCSTLPSSTTRSRCRSTRTRSRTSKPPTPRIRHRAFDARRPPDPSASGTAPVDDPKSKISIQDHKREHGHQRELGRPRITRQGKHKPSSAHAHAANTQYRHTQPTSKTLALTLHAQSG